MSLLSGFTIVLGFLDCLFKFSIVSLSFLSTNTQVLPNFIKILLSLEVIFSGFLFSSGAALGDGSLSEGSLSDLGGTWVHLISCLDLPLISLSSFQLLTYL